ncbi:MAG: ROK family protein [Verrucomicrobia bacterium]|nr:ROK family protein [Verrucomicrobiota bacterium]
MDRNYLGIEIGGTKLQLVMGTGSGGILRRWRYSVARQEGGAGIRRQIEATLPGIVAGSTIRGVGVGFGGPVDWRTGQICCSHQIEGWADFGLAAWLRSLAQAPVQIDNDANVGALGEALCGAGKGLSPVFYVTLGSGVGGGLVVDGQIYHGAVPGESEIGHVRLDRAGTTVESRCSGWAVDAKIRTLIDRKPDCLVGRLAGSVRGGEAKQLGKALANGDELAREILAETAEDMAFAFSHVVHLSHPVIIVIGGGLSLVGEPLRAAVAEAMKRFTMEAFAPGPTIALAALGEDSVPVGALMLAHQRLAT